MRRTTTKPEALALALAALALGGCESMNHVTVAPKLLVEGCVQEAYPASHEGWGPMCESLNKWNQLHGWAYGGGPPMANKPTPAEAQALAVK